MIQQRASLGVLVLRRLFVPVPLFFSLPLFAIWLRSVGASVLIRVNPLIEHHGASILSLIFETWSPLTGLAYS